MNELSAVGVMSGSSLDGLDICYCDYKYFESKWQFQNLKGETIPFPRDIYALLLKARDLSGEELVKLDVRLGIWMGQMIRDFCQRHNYRPQIIRARPKKDLKNLFVSTCSRSARELLKSSIFNKEFNCEMKPIFF